MPKTFASNYDVLTQTSNEGKIIEQKNLDEVWLGK